MIAFSSTSKFDKPTILLLSESAVKRNTYTFKNADIITAIKESSKQEVFTGKAGQSLSILVQGQLVFLVGIGSDKKRSLTALRKVVRAAILSSVFKNVKKVDVITGSKDQAFNVAVVEGIALGNYAFDKYLTKKKEGIADFTVIAPKTKALEDAVVVCHGVNAARDLVNENADVATSDLFEKEVKKLVKGNAKVKLEILKEKELKAKGLGLHLSVNQGSNKEPRLIIVKYKGAAAKQPYTAIVGKGVTFDTGGINLKPSGHIETMKMDMGGSAAVFGVLKNTLALKLKKNVIFAFGLAENAIGKDAYKPGDVISGYANKSVEVANTDAEGRLVLADALSYLVKNYKPKRVIDIATLTGACVVALGYDYSGLVSNDDRLARQLVQSSNATDDRVWRLPSYPELKDSVKSKIADIRNLGTPRGAAGALTAAEFLRQFVDGTTWAHLDIAGTAFIEESSRNYFGYGATGSSVRLLTHFIKNN